MTAKRSESTRRREARTGTPGSQAYSLGNRIWYRSTQRVLQMFWVLVYGMRRWGIEHIPAEGPVLVASNHQSHFDPPLIGCCSPRRLAFVARSSLFKFAFFAKLIRSFGAFPIDQSGSGFAGIKETLRRLKRGEGVVIFPEGSRTSDGQIGPFQPGIRTLALRSGAMIVPMAIEGAYHAFPRSRNFPRTGTIHVRFGEPLMPDQIRELGEEALLVEVERRVRQCFAQVCSHPAMIRQRRRASDDV